MESKLKAEKEALPTKNAEKKSEKKIDASDISEKPLKKEKQPVDQAHVVYILILSIFGLLMVYLFLALLSFFHLLPRFIRTHLPIIGSVVIKAESQDRKIQILQEKIEDYKKINHVGEYSLQMAEENELDKTLRKVPFLFKIKINKNKVNGHDYGELYIDQVLVIRTLVGANKEDAYDRAKTIARKISTLLGAAANFETLEPRYVAGTFGAFLGDDLVFSVTEDDGILNNSTQTNVMRSWLNNVRVALGASKYDKPFEGPPDPEEKHKLKVYRVETIDEKGRKVLPKIVSSVTPDLLVSTPTAISKNLSRAAAVARSSPTQQDRIKELKKVVAVYEKMSTEKINGIFETLTHSEVLDLLSLLSERNVAKLFSVMDKQKAATYYTELVTANVDGLWQPAKEFKKMITVIASMPPADAVQLLSNLNSEDVLKILQIMETSKKAKVLAAMDPKLAGEYLQKLRQKNKTKPEAIKQ